MFRFLEEYLKHFALNLGQALQGVRYLFSHPDVDEIASRGSVGHAVRSAGLRSKRVFNDLFFALIPPHTHHSRDELGRDETNCDVAMVSVRLLRLALYGIGGDQSGSGARRQEMGSTMPEI